MQHPEQKPERPIIRERTIDAVVKYVEEGKFKLAIRELPPQISEASIKKAVDAQRSGTHAEIEAAIDRALFDEHGDKMEILELLRSAKEKIAGALDVKTANEEIAEAADLIAVYAMRPKFHREAKKEPSLPEEDNPRVKAWLQYMEKNHKVPSTVPVQRFAEQRVAGIKKVAEIKLKQGTPIENLSEKEQMALIDEKHLVSQATEHSEKLKRGLHKNQNYKMELAFVALLHALCERGTKLEDGSIMRRVLKSSHEEDVFRGSDIVLETFDPRTHTSRWHSIDLTTDPKMAVSKEERANRHHHVRLENLRNMLIREGELGKDEPLNVYDQVNPVDRNFAKLFTANYLNAVAAGNPESVLQIFEQTTAASQQSRQFESEIQKFLRNIGGEAAA